MMMQTERLLLRPFGQRDAGDVYELARDPLVGPAAGWQPHKSVEDSRQIIRNVLSAENTFAVVDKQSGRVIGSIGIRSANVGRPVPADQPELGYWLAVPYWGRGLIPEAVKAILAYCFNTLHTSAVWCGYYEGNEQSKRVQEKCGFEPSHAMAMDVPLLHTRRLCHFTRLTREQYKKSSVTD